MSTDEGKDRQGKQRPRTVRVEGELWPTVGITEAQYQQLIKVLEAKGGIVRQEQTPIVNMSLEGRGSCTLPNGVDVNDVLHIPKFKCNLLSVSKLSRDLNCAITFLPESFFMHDIRSGTLIGTGKCQNGLYKMEMVKKRHALATSVSTWHKRLGHPSNSKLQHLDFFKGTPLNSKVFCDSCMKAKFSRLPFPVSTTKTHACFDLIHCDIWGKYRTPSLTRASYFLTIVDDFSRATWVYLLKQKHEASMCLKAFHKMVQVQFEKNIRRIRHLLETARALRFEANLPTRFWGECVLTVATETNGDKFKMKEDQEFSWAIRQEQKVEEEEIFIPPSIWDDEAIEEKPKDLIGEPNEIEIGHSEPIEEFEDDFEHHTQTEAPSEDQTEVDVGPEGSQDEDNLFGPTEEPTFNSDSNNFVEPSKRKRTRPTYLDDYEVQLPPSLDHKQPTSSRESSTVQGPTRSKRIHTNGRVDFHETFAPVAKLVTVRTLLTVAVKREWQIHQLDVNNAFLNGDLHEEVYMKVPQGFKKENDNRVCKLKKSLCGLKQASRNWYQKFTTSLIEIGFKQTGADHSLFTFKRRETFIATLIYVDDVIITGNNSGKIQEIKKFLHERFSIKDLGPLKFFLGIEVAQTKEGMVLSQRKYTLDILTDTGKTGCKPSAFPMEQNLILGKCETDKQVDGNQYRRLISRLLYLQATRPDITYTVNILSQFVGDPRQSHMDAADRLLGYLKVTPGQGILIPKGGGINLTAYSDSD
ncbi:putative RNA-directed DNA polymerase [Tanacetum coccineum]